MLQNELSNVFACCDYMVQSKKYLNLILSLRLLSLKHKLTQKKDDYFDSQFLDTQEVLCSI